MSIRYSAAAAATVLAFAGTFVGVSAASAATITAPTSVVAAVPAPQGMSATPGCVSNGQVTVTITLTDAFPAPKAVFEYGIFTSALSTPMGSVTVIKPGSESPSFAAAAGDTVYVSVVGAGGMILKQVVQSCAPEPIHVTAVAPTQTEVCGPDNDTVVLAATEGIAYAMSVWKNGQAQVTATAQDGYVNDGPASFPLTDVAKPCPTPTPTVTSTPTPTPTKTAPAPSPSTSTPANAPAPATTTPAASKPAPVVKNGNNDVPAAAHTDVVSSPLQGLAIALGGLVGLGFALRRRFVRQH